MPKLHLVGITPDHSGLVLSEHARARRGDLVLEIDHRLVEAVEKAQRLRALDEGRGLASRALPTKRDPGPGDGTAGTRLSPREIQQRLRMGETVASLSKASGVDESWIERFSAPVLAEKSRLIEKARGLTYHKGKDGPSGVTLGPAVAANVIDKGVSLTLPDLESGWGAFQRPGGEWCVSFSFSYRGKRAVAEWDLDTKKRELIARNKLAAELGWREPGKRLPQPAPAPVAAVAAPPKAPSRPPVRDIAPHVPVVELGADGDPDVEPEEGTSAPDAKEISPAEAEAKDASPAEASDGSPAEAKEGSSAEAQAKDASPEGAKPAAAAVLTEEITIPRGLIVTVTRAPVSTPQTLPGTEPAEAGARPNGLPPGAAGAVTMAQRPGPAPVTSSSSSAKAKAGDAPAKAPARKAPSKASPPSKAAAPAPPKPATSPKPAAPGKAAPPAPASGKANPAPDAPAAGKDAPASGKDGPATEKALPAAGTDPPGAGKDAPALKELSGEAKDAAAEDAPAPPPAPAKPASRRRGSAKAAQAKAEEAKPAPVRKARKGLGKRVAAAPSQPLRSEAPVSPSPAAVRAINGPSKPKRALGSDATGPVSLAARPGPAPVKGRSSPSSSNPSSESSPPEPSTRKAPSDPPSPSSPPAS